MAFHRDNDKLFAELHYRRCILYSITRLHLHHFLLFLLYHSPLFLLKLESRKEHSPGRMNVSELVETSPFQRDGNSDRDREESKTKKNKQERQTSYLRVQFSHISTTVGNEKEKKPSRAPNNLA